MSDYRDPYNQDPLDPGRTTMRDDPRRSNSGLAWIAGGVFLVVILALIFGLGRTGDRTASTGGSPPAATTGAAPSGGATTTPRTTTGQSSSQ